MNFSLPAQALHKLLKISIIVLIVTSFQIIQLIERKQTTAPVKGNNRSNPKVNIFETKIAFFGKKKPTLPFKNLEAQNLQLKTKTNLMQSIFTKSFRTNHRSQSHKKY
jgi:hypothetical protein